MPFVSIKEAARYNPVPSLNHVAKAFDYVHKVSRGIQHFYQRDGHYLRISRFGWQYRGRDSGTERSGFRWQALNRFLSKTHNANPKINHEMNK